jgi:hypothetical protein
MPQLFLNFFLEITIIWRAERVECWLVNLDSADVIGNLSDWI